MAVADYFDDDIIVHANTQRLAWGVMLISFTIFCSLVFGGILTSYLFLFESRVPIETWVEVGRGTALLTDESVEGRGLRLREDITNRSLSISTDSQSQTNVLFYMPGQNHRRLLAVATLKNNSETSLIQAQMPRFWWSHGQYEIRWQGFRGEASILVLKDNGRPLTMWVEAARGGTVQINGSGHYNISANDSRLRVTTHEGEAVVYGMEQRLNRLVLRGQSGAVLYGIAEPVVSPSRRNLLVNSAFALSVDSQVNGETSTYPPGRWGCTNVQDALPRGVFRMDYWDGRSALRLLRRDNASTHGETGCRQPIEVASSDVSSYNFMEIEATFLISYQSLSACGIQGSECPLMLKLVYDDIYGIRRDWFQGFYAVRNAELDYPLRCVSCSQDHLQINEKVWYTFETGNLFNAIPPEQRPARLHLLEFYASGHQYDVFVSDLGVFVGYVDVMPSGASSSGG
ncbi:MAG: hypothetical protein RML73_08920 [Anaerolineae bacterium]|nr:hypothetical protein [Anaerolineae bacterium]